jgi:hypothetical protein
MADSGLASAFCRYSTVVDFVAVTTSAYFQRIRRPDFQTEIFEENSLKNSAVSKVSPSGYSGPRPIEKVVFGDQWEIKNAG